MKDLLISYKMRAESIDSILSNESDSFKDDKDVLNYLKTFNTNEMPEEDLDKIIHLSGDNSFFHTKAQGIDVSCASLNYVVEYSSNDKEFEESFTKLSLMEDETRLKLIVLPDDLAGKYTSLADKEGIKLISKSALDSDKWIW